MVAVFLQICNHNYRYCLGTFLTKIIQKSSVLRGFTPQFWFLGPQGNLLNKIPLIFLKMEDEIVTNFKLVIFYLFGFKYIYKGKYGLAGNSMSYVLFLFRVWPHSPFSRYDWIASDYVVAFGSQVRVTLNDLIAVAKMP